MFGRDPKKIEQAMKKLNINTRELQAREVVIRKDDGDIVIKSPEIMVMNMMGRDVYQITGQAAAQPAAAAAREEDVRTVMEHTGKDKATAEKKLEELNNDLARAIMELKKSR